MGLHAVERVVLTVGTLLGFGTCALVGMLKLTYDLTYMLAMTQCVRRRGAIGRYFPRCGHVYLVGASADDNRGFLKNCQSKLRGSPTMRRFAIVCRVSSVPILFNRRRVTTGTFSMSDAFFGVFPCEIVTKDKEVIHSESIIVAHSF